MSKLFTLMKKGDLQIPPNKKIIPADEFSLLLSAKELLEDAKKESLEYRKEITKECEQLREEAQKEGFEAGLKTFNLQIALLEEEIKMQKARMQKKIASLATAAVKKIIGKELETHPEVIVDLVTTALKAVSQHKKVAIYVNKKELAFIEKERDKIKKNFEHLETLTIAARENVAPGGCVIETEAGIINAQLDNQINALKKAFEHILQTEGGD